LAVLAALALFVSTSTGCGPSYVDKVEGLQIAEDAEILDDEVNTQILNVVSTYQAAMEKRDVAALEKLVSAEYYENAGTTDNTEDDYGSAGLKDVFDRFGEHVETVKFHVLVKDLRLEGDRAQVFYEYTWNFLYKVGDVPRWESGTDVNRLDLVKQEGRWWICRGL
jgi:hypothetical protein